MYELRDLNSNDICDINKIKYELDQNTKGVTQMEFEEESQEQLIQIQITKIESINNKIEQKVVELDEVAFKLEECENESFQYENQVESFKRELHYLEDTE